MRALLAGFGGTFLMLSLNLFIQRCVSGIHWYLMVKERGKKEKKTVKLLTWLLTQPLIS